MTEPTRPDVPKLSPLALALAVLVGATAGFVTQVWRSNSGMPPLAPPLSLPATLVVMAVVLVVLGMRLQRALKPLDEKNPSKAAQPRRPVHALHAVRLLAAARASQVTGLLFGGFGAGLLAQVVGRTVGVTSEVWLPMLLTVMTGLALFAAGLYAESACRVPPSDEAGETDRLLA